MRTKVTLLACAFALVAAPAARAANVAVCVDVKVRGPEKPETPPPTVAAPPDPRPLLELDGSVSKPPPPPPKPAAADPSLPIGQDPISYLKRLIEYFVTHERGFVAVQKDCAQRIEVELYPLREGWTVFARYTGTGREERVDYLFADELSQFAERSVTALLYEKPINTTILRDTVLRADSKKSVQRVRGTNHFVLSLGTQLRGGKFPTQGTAPDGTYTISDGDPRFMPSIELGFGYRGKYESWGMEAMFGLAIGTDRSGVKQNPDGGNVDYGGNVNFALHFLYYFNPRGLWSFFLGAGGSFEAMWFYATNPQGNRESNDRNTLAAGGLDLDLVAGVEFMRANKVQFYLQITGLLPVYLVRNGDGAKPINTYFGGGALTLGMLF